MYNQRQEIQKILDGDYNTKEKVKINGEVFTPFSYIDEMIDMVSEEVWNDFNKKWFDRCAGLGNFHAVVVERLMEGLKEQIPDDKKRYKHIIENQLYFVELNPRSVVWIRRLFNPGNKKTRKYKMNLVCADTLDRDHPGWDKVGYMWDEDDIENRKLRKALREKKDARLEENRNGK